MEDVQRRIGQTEGAIQEHSRSIGRLQGQFGIIIGLQLAQVAALVTIIVKVFAK